MPVGRGQDAPDAAPPGTDLPQPASSGGVPDPQRAAKLAGHDFLPARQERRLVAAGMILAEARAEFARRRVVEIKHVSPVCPGGGAQGPPIVRIHEMLHAPSGANILDTAELATFRPGPDTDGPVESSGRERPAIRRKSHRLHGLAVAGTGLDFLPRVRRPTTHPRALARGQGLSIRRKSDAPEMLIGFRDALPNDPAFRIVNPDESEPSGGECRAIRREGAGIETARNVPAFLPGLSVPKPD